MSHIQLPFTPTWLYWPLPWAWLLLLLGTLPLFAWLGRRPRRRPMVRFSSLTDLRTAASGPRHRLRGVLPVLRILALGALIIGAARPQRPNESRVIHVEGIAIQMVVDISSSMLDTDLTPPGTPPRSAFTRLEAVKRVFRDFVMGAGELPGRPNDLIGIIRFARFADSVCPLTLDRDALLKILEDTRTIRYLDARGVWSGNPDEDGTAIGDALALAVERLRELERTGVGGEQYTVKSRIAILLTDGENNMGTITPRQAGDLAALYGIRVYTIIAGTGEQVPLRPRRPVDDSDLRYIADVSGGRHFAAQDVNALQAIYTEIDTLERTRTEERRFVEWHELDQPFLLAAFALLALQLLLDATLLRRIP